MEKQRIGIIGLGLMGQNLALNMESHGFSVSLFNRSFEKTQEFLNGRGLHKRFHGTRSLSEFVESLEHPRKVLLTVKAGAAIDEAISSLIPYLEEGDMIIDGGNSHFRDTMRRNRELKELGLYLLDISFSGGEKGALEGPAIFPAGELSAFEHVKPFLTAISAKIQETPCFTYLGHGGAGHYIKMVHNGIEYSDMQLIAETYFLLKKGLGLSAHEIHEVFTEWNKGELDSYLIEITADIFAKMDSETGRPLLEMIKDTASQKGTGKWASQNALDLGVPLSIITESVFARVISSMKEERTAASKLIEGPNEEKYTGNRKEFIEAVRKALYMSKICAYTQGFAQMKAASTEYGWDLPYGDIAMTFRAGCIIRARFLDKIKEAYEQDSKLSNLLLNPHFRNITQNYQSALRHVLSTAIGLGIPVPAFSSSLAYFDSYRTAELPANLLQAQRDYFGAHTYERNDKKGSFHTEWSN